MPDQEFDAELATDIAANRERIGRGWTCGSCGCEGNRADRCYGCGELWEFS